MPGLLHKYLTYFRIFNECNDRKKVKYIRRTRTYEILLVKNF